MKAMKKSSKVIFGVALLLIVVASIFAWLRSHRTEKTNETQAETEVKSLETAPVTGPPTIVYKTKADYFDLVPVGISGDKKSIVSYPNMSDMLPSSYPTKLSDGYLFGSVSANSGFLKLTRDEYAALKELPSPEKLHDSIRDADPFTEMFDCGSRFQFEDVEKELNQIIDSGKLSSRCNKIK
jgi:hypothetical protein